MNNNFIPDKEKNAIYQKGGSLGEGLTFSKGRNVGDGLTYSKGGPLTKETSQSNQVPLLNGIVKGSFKKGGMVKSTGLYRLHKGEKVLTASKTKALNKKK